MARLAANPEHRPSVVTGASSGIGRATAAALAGAGHPVVLGARRLDACEEEVTSIRSRGGQAVALPLDLADADSVGQFAKAATDAFGSVEIVVSNAARNIAGSVLDTDSRVIRGRPRREPGRHPPPRAGPPAGNDRAATGGHRFRDLRRGRTPPTGHGRLRHLQVGPRGLRAGAADGARGDRCALHHHPARPHHDRHGPRLGRRGHRTRHRAMGSVGLRPALELHASRRCGPGHRGRRHPPPRRARHGGRIAARSTCCRAPPRSEP